MLRSRACFSVLSSLVVSTLMACSVTTTPTGTGGPDTTTPATPVTPTTPTDPTMPVTPTTPTAKVTFSYSTVALPAASLKIGSIGGSSASDVWMVAAPSTAASKDPWTAYHYDGTKWDATTLTATTGRPNFGAVSLGGSNVYLGFSYAADVFRLQGSSFEKSASFSVTSGYTMAAVGSKVYVGTQENFGAGPLYVLSGSNSQQIAVTDGNGGVSGIWGASEDDVWLARSGALGHLVAGVYQDVDMNPVTDVHGTAKNDVWTISDTGARHFDGTNWTDIAIPTSGESSDKPQSITALAKDEVIVTTYSAVYRWDGTAFTKESRTNAPSTSVSMVGRVGTEAWVVTGTSISRLAPDAKK
ncbi:MAG: hypothetical protein QOI41_2217 [Myxococcales bacterium]|nr:hypothetical protein [Myxococcales bacterium]